MKEIALLCGLLSGSSGVFSAIAFMRGSVQVPWVQTWSGQTPAEQAVLLTADRHALWLAGLVRLAAPPVSSQETERTDMLDGHQKAA